MASLPACADTPSKFKPNFCGHWAMGVVAPNHMEAWVETLEVKDDRGRWVKIPQGVVGELAQTEGWDNGRWMADRTIIDSAGAPMEVFIRWQSLAEPQTYSWQFTVPEAMRQALVKKETFQWNGKSETTCRNDIAIGVAPGGRVVVWVSGTSLSRVEILRDYAEVEALGPGQGWGKGYAYPLSDEAKKYIEEHGIPYDSW
ncbi:DUF2931 family protein [Dyella sp. C11]|uniref:DUF2931 family protein n=1 Tax=Dyella sp. C11 TaxID=2126991 RepID=UPI00130038C6|nr:DUF2931 family protein [Dyella sp. C11]